MRYTRNEAMGHRRAFHVKQHRVLGPRGEHSPGSQTPRLGCCSPSRRTAPKGRHWFRRKPRLEHAPAQRWPASNRVRVSTDPFSIRPTPVQTHSVTFPAPPAALTGDTTAVSLSESWPRRTPWSVALPSRRPRARASMEQWLVDRRISPRQLPKASPGPCDSKSISLGGA
jgi:hypothetical protein